MKKYIKISVLFVVLGLVAVFAVKAETFIYSSDFDTIIQQKIDTVASPKIRFVEQKPMIASWYGPKFHGKLTANGEIYDQMAFTAAHKTLPFGTILRVTNPVNNRSILVRINDRGPYIEGRNIDLSKGTALFLGMVDEGVIKVEIEKVEIDELDFPILASN